MTVRRLPLIPHSRRKSSFPPALFTFIRQCSSARPAAHKTTNGVGTAALPLKSRGRYGKAMAHRINGAHQRFQRGFHTSTARREEKEEKDYYKIVKVAETASLDQIKKSYFAEAMRLHPDRAGSDKEFKKLQEAYSILSDESKRTAYDSTRAGRSPAYTKPAARTKPHRAPDVQSQKSFFDGVKRSWAKEEAGRAETEAEANAPPPGPRSGRARLRRERQAAGEAGAGAHGAQQRPLEMGFRPRSSWDPRFAKFFDDWSKKMKEKGWDPTQTRPGGDLSGPKATNMMDGDLFSEYIKHMRKQGQDPLGGLFSTSAGRGSAAGVWMKNRMAVLDREEAKKAGGAWERGGVRRGDNLSRPFDSHWHKGPAGSKRPVYSSEGPSSGGESTASTGRKGTRGMAYAWNAADGMEHAAEWDAAQKLGGYGTGEETFNAPWDSVPLRNFQKEVPRPWWAAGPPPEGKDPHVYDAWSPNPEFAGAAGERPRRHPGLLEETVAGAGPRPSTAAAATFTDGGVDGDAEVYTGPVKRDYSKGHQLDERYEEDRLRMAANERRMLGFVGAAVVIGAVLAAGRAAN